MFFISSIGRGFQSLWLPTCDCNTNLPCWTTTGRITPETRYRNFLDAEAAFDALYSGWPERTVQTLRLPIRALRQSRYQNKVYRRMTMQAFWRRA